MQARPRVHATLVVTAPELAASRGAPIREFWLLAVEAEPEPHFQDTPVGTPTEAGTRPATRTAVHGHWVEVTFEPPGEGAHATRTEAYDLRGAGVGRGPVGDLLAQEFLEAFEDAERIAHLQREADRARAASDATRWDEAQKRAIEEAERRLEEAVYASPFRRRVVLVALAPRHAEALARDFAALNLPDATFVPLRPAPERPYASAPSPSRAAARDLPRP